MRTLLTTNPVSRRLILSLLTGVGFFLLGYGGIYVWADTHTLSPIWPATALGFVMVLRLSKSRADDAAMLTAILLAGFAANRLGGSSFQGASLFAVINVLDVLAGVVAMRRAGMPRITTVPSAVRFLLLAGLSPSLLGALLAAGVMAVTGHSAQALPTGVQWFFANLLGVLILFPFGMTISLRQFAKLKLENRMLSAIAVFVGLGVMTMATFRYSLPTMFLVMILCMVAGIRFRLLGAGAALIVVSGVGFASVRLHPQAHNLAWVEVLQFYLGCISIVSVRAAMLMNERDLHIAIIERRHRRAVRASRFKSQLLSHVSHEVRSPLSAIIGFSSMLEKGTLTPDRAPEFAAIIAHNGELLLRLHDDLLDMGRAEAGALTMNSERVAVGSTLRTCVSAIRLDATLGGKDVLIETVEDSLALHCDPLRLAQILNNLIANAFKYGDNFSPIRVRARALEDGFGRIEIVNNGPGIPRGEHGAVFLPFRRSAEVGRNVPGAGLGLSIAKLLVEAQGGRIAFESVPGRQTCFWIDLPLAA